MGYNPQKSTWMNPNIEYLFNHEIIEYDIQDAGFNIIKQFKLLPPEKIRELERLGKGLERHIAVGKLQRDDKDLSRALGDKFAEVRSLFIQANDLQDNDIISVKKDAIYTIGQCNRLKFGQVNFAPKNVYSSYIRFPGIQNLEVYYSDSAIDIKGMSDSSVNRHRLYMLDFLKTVISMLESRNPRLRRYLSEFIDKYKWGELNEVYYLEFNNISAAPNPMFNYQNVIIPLFQITLKELNQYG